MYLLLHGTEFNMANIMQVIQAGDSAMYKESVKYFR